MRALFSILSPAGQRARLTVLIFHRVLAEPDPLFPEEMDARRFDQVCRWMARWFQVMPLPAAVQALAEQRLPARAACITFDDGYADNHDVALPILARHGLPATFFIATGFLDGGVMWNDILIESIRHARAPQLDLQALGLGTLPPLPLDDVPSRRRAIDAAIGQLKYLQPAQRLQAVHAVAAQAGSALPTGLMMSTAQLQALHAAGMTIGGHTVQHPILATLQAAEAAEEIGANKRRLEAVLQAPVDHFAYPNGRPGRDFTAATAALVRQAGYKSAVTTAKGAAMHGCDPYQIPRFSPWDLTPTRYGLRLAANLWSPRPQLA